jgi:predicted transcriptional regulator of viral defense system
LERGTYLISQQRFFGFRPQWFDGRKVQITDVEKTIAVLRRSQLLDRAKQI